VYVTETVTLTSTVHVIITPQPKGTVHCWSPVQLQVLNCKWQITFC